MFIPPPRDIMLSILRQKIDHMDNHIYNLLAIRLKLAEETARFKTNITCSDRETAIIDRLSRKGRVNRDLVETMWTRIFEESRRLQEKELS
jgi:chorismate mutase